MHNTIFKIYICFRKSIKMTKEVQNPDKTVAALIHLSTFSQFFFPFGNFLFPLILWTAKKNDPFVNEHGKQALNFQISLYLYMVFLFAIGITGILWIALSLDIQEPFYFNRYFELTGTPVEALPLLYFVIFMVLLILALVLLGIYAVISATIKAGEGKYFNYPLSINFLNAEKKSARSSKAEKVDPSKDHHQL